MKKLFLFFLICSIWIGLLTQFSIAQETKDNLLDEIVLNFSLSGDPTAEEVGFDNLKSFWGLEYELVLTDSSILEKIGRCQRTEQYKLSCFSENSKKSDKKVRKISTLIRKGKLVKKQLLAQSDREISIPIKLDASTIDIFNKGRISNDNPTFVLFVKTKVFTKTSDKVKFKKKFAISKVYPLKSFLPDKSFGDYWNVKNFGIAFGIQRVKSAIIGFNVFKN